MFYSLFTVPLSLFCSYFFSFLPSHGSPLLTPHSPITLKPLPFCHVNGLPLNCFFFNITESLSLFFWLFFLPITLSLSLSLWPLYHILHGLHVIVAYFCSRPLFFCRNSADLMNKQAQCTFLHYKSYIIAAHLVLLTKLIKYINV